MILLAVDEHEIEGLKFQFGDAVDGFLDAGDVDGEGHAQVAFAGGTEAAAGDGHHERLFNQP